MFHTRDAEEMGLKLIIKKSDIAVSQVLATSLLLIIAMVLMSMIYSYYLSYPPPNSSASIDISGTLEERTRYLTALGNYEEDCSIILIHRGGDSLSIEDEIMVTVGEVSEDKTIGECMDSESKEDGLWDIGERLVLQAEDIANCQLSVVVFDSFSESVLFQGTFQKNTYVTTQGTFNVQHNLATLCMDYDFKEQGSGKVRFAYKNQSDVNWTYTSWIPRTGRGFYHKLIVGLSCVTTYFYIGEIKYDDTIESGKMNSFTTKECP